MNGIMRSEENVDLAGFIKEICIESRSAGKNSRWEKLMLLDGNAFVSNRVFLRISMEYSIRTDILKQLENPAVDMLLPYEIEVTGYGWGDAHDKNGDKIGSFTLMPDGMLVLIFDREALEKKTRMEGVLTFEMYLSCAPSPEYRSVTLCFSDNIEITLQIEAAVRLSYDPKIEISGLSMGSEVEHA